MYCCVRLQRNARARFSSEVPYGPYANLPSARREECLTKLSWSTHDFNAPLALEGSEDDFEPFSLKATSRALNGFALADRPQHESWNEGEDVEAPLGELFKKDG